MLRERKKEMTWILVKSERSLVPSILALKRVSITMTSRCKVLYMLRKIFVHVFTCLLMPYIFVKTCYVPFIILGSGS